jgi:hypothetical protein
MLGNFPLQEDERLLEDDLPPDFYPRGQEIDKASTDAPISQNNVGFKLLQKMGWKEGKGLGKQEHGTVATPVPAHQTSPSQQLLPDPQTRHTDAGWELFRRG